MPKNYTTANCKGMVNSSCDETNNNTGKIRRKRRRVSDTNSFCFYWEENLKKIKVQITISQIF